MVKTRSTICVSAGDEVDREDPVPEDIANSGVLEDPW
jgi:hypothetical protein